MTTRPDNRPKVQLEALRLDPETVKDLEPKAAADGVRGGGRGSQVSGIV